MTKQFNLSNEIVRCACGNDNDFIFKSKVEEFIRLLEKEVIVGNPHSRQMLIKLKEIVGEELVK